MVAPNFPDVPIPVSDDEAEAPEPGEVAETVLDSQELGRPLVAVKEEPTAQDMAAPQVVVAEGSGDPNTDLDTMLRAQQAGTGGAVGLEVSLALKQ
eukprot:13867347-Alexandrium_andersonii.AAC.1